MPSSSSRRRRALGEFSLFHRAIALIAATTFLPGPVPVAFAVDILRHGIGAASGTGAPQTSSSGAGSGSSADSTATARQDAADALARTDTAIQAVQNMQAAAHAIALSVPVNNLGANPNAAGTLPDVPDGLMAGGLVISGTPTGASAPTQTTGANGSTTVNIVQNQQQAFIDWSSFNIGKHTTLNFDQSAGGASVGAWIAFNQVTDPTGNPSQILGSIHAQGQVYVINQNGIIFGGSSQVNVNTLVASSLPINDNLVNSGLLNQVDVQFLFSALPQAAGANGTAAVTPPHVYTPSGNNGDITVQAGAQITSPSVSGSGGRIALIAPNVTNNGSISTPDGQTIIAGGLQVGFTAHDSTDPSLRGLDVYVGSVGSYGGTVTNNGVIDAPRGNVTMMGKEVKQDGMITSTTSVALNGRIDLDAYYNAITNVDYDTVKNPGSPPFFFLSSGTVSMGAGSVTRILPEWASTTTVVGTQLALVSQINVTGQSIYFGQDSTLLAPNAQVTVSAGIWDYVDTSHPAVATFINTGGQIYVDSDAMINVAGSTDISASVNEYILTVQLRSNELANSPLQRTGVLDNQTVTVDLRQTGTYNGRVWYGTPLADLTGYVGVIQRTVGELTTAGGTISLKSGGSVVVQPTATLDVSGGWVNYQGSQVQTTQVVYNGQIINIANATPDLVYSGIYTGQTTTTQSAFGASSTTTSLFGLSDTLQPGYTQGGNGGTLNLSAPALALDGGMFGYTVSGGLQQRSTPPTASTLNVSIQSQDGVAPYGMLNPSNVTVYLRPGGTQAAVGAFAVSATDVPLTTLSAGRISEVDISPDLVTTYGFGNFSVVNPSGGIILPATSSLITSPLGSVSLVGANLDIEGTIISRGGSITLKAYDIALDAFPSDQPPFDPTRGLVKLGSAAVINASGLIVDERNQAGLLMPLVTQGGSITLAGATVSLAAGGLLDVSGGARVSSTAVVTYGNGGSLTIKAGQDVANTGTLGGGLDLGAVMRGFSGATGGSLKLQAPVVQIGGTTTDSATLLLDPSFFSQGGFNSFTLTGLGEVTAVPDVSNPGVVIAVGTVLAPVVQSWVAQVDSQGVTLTPQTLAQGVRQPVSLDFEAPGVTNQYQPQLEVRGAILMNAGSSIVTDPQGSVKFNGQTVAIFGSVTAPGGTITVSGAGRYPLADTTAIGSSAYTTVDLAPTSSLSTAGKVVVVPDAYGQRKGSVLAGGTISVSGNIVAEAGSVLDASGTSGVLDLTLAEAGQLANNTLTGTSANGTLAVATHIDSNGGSISFTGGQMLFLDSTLHAQAGGATASGGSLSVTSGRFYAQGVQPSPNDVNILVTQSTPAIPAPIYSAGDSAIGKTVKTAGGAVIAQQGYFHADTFENGGFDSLTLAGTLQFSGPVSLTAASSLTLATGGVLKSDAAVNLSASYVDIGMAFRTPLQQSEQSVAQPLQANGTPFYLQPTYGPGRLNVAASLIDIGHLSLQNTGAASFTAANGDIRGNGILDVAGSITLTAGQVYTPTAVSFTIAAYDYTTGGGLQSGSVTLAASGVRSLPLSAGGTINVYASTINQGGTLVAPAGIINLGWDGTGTIPTDMLSGAGIVNGVSLPTTTTLNILAGSRTSVSEIDPITGLGVSIPYGFSSDGTSWIDPRGIDVTGGGLPAKAVNTSARNITAQNGALIDLRGGGDLYAFRWVSGTGGTVDILASQGSFAVLPGYSGKYAPYAPFNSVTNDPLNLASAQSGYTNSTLKVGDSVYLAGGSGLAAGTYTLLPARFALLQGAFLVTPKSGEPQGSVLQPDGSSLVSGYQFNSLNPAVQAHTLYSSFEVASASVVNSRADYVGFNASTFLQARAVALNLSVPLLPQDGGNLVLESLQTMAFFGQVMGAGATGGRGADIDLNSPSDILIATTGTSAAPGVLVLDAAQLSSYGVESLLIGGQRTTTTTGTQVSVRTGNITVANSSSSSLAMPELILVANNSIAVNAGASIVQTGAMHSAAATLLIGSSASSGSGNGVLLRVSSDTSAQLLRSGVTSASGPSLSIGAGAVLTGNSITLDSTGAMTLNTSAAITGQSLNVDNSRISLQLNNPGSLQSSPGLVIAGSLLQNLQLAQSLSLLSYSSIDIYGTGQLGTAQMASLALHAGEIRGFNNNSGGGVSTVTLTAQKLLLDNQASASVPGAVNAATGSLVLNALNTLTIGSGALTVDQFSGISVTAGNGIVLQGSGGLSVQGTFSAATPVVTAAAFASQSITSSGAMTLTSSTATGTAVAGGLGAALSLTGSSLTTGTDIELPSGTLSLSSTAGNTTVAGTLNVGGAAQNFYDQVKYTDAGSITLSSATGNVSLSAGSFVNISANALGGNAGTLTVKTTAGTLNLGGSLSGTAAQGQSGSFVLTTGTLPTLSALNLAMDSAGIDYSRSIRVLSGNVTVDGTVTSHLFNLSADQGSITVTGAINASGSTGGSIQLSANGSIVLSAALTQTTSQASSSNAVTLSDATGVVVGQAVSGLNVVSGTYVTAINGRQITLSQALASAVPTSTTLTFGARLSAAGTNFDSAGKGGNISLMAGSERSGVINTGATLNLQTGSQIDLSVASNIASSTLNLTANVATNVPANLGGYDTITSTQAGIITLLNGQTLALAAGMPTSVVGAKSVTLSSDGSVSFAGSSAWGLYTGTLQLRAPQNSGATDLQMSPINATITGASVITAEGYKIFTPAGGVLNAAYFTSNIKTNATSFISHTGTITTRLLAGNAGLSSSFFLLPGAEIINLSGDLTLGTTTSRASVGDFDLSSARYGTGSHLVPGVLTLRASGNLVFNDSISDGFTSSLYTAPLQKMNTALPANLQSWSYRLTAGADFTGVDYHQVLATTSLATGKGSLLLGRPNGASIAAGAGSSATTVSVIGASTSTTYKFQAIRTGTGSIDISTGRDVQFLNQFATIYTVGAQVLNSSLGGTFDVPQPDMTGVATGNLGVSQETTPLLAQYTMGGGNVNISAKGDIIQLAQNSAGTVTVNDSKRSMPTNWLYRRGAVDPLTGLFLQSLYSGNGNSDVSSTSWWVDFNNFFDNVGALGGGNITLVAGHDVSNINAAIPTNARMVGKDASGNPIAPSVTNLVELGGGNLVVQTGHNINAGVYYVERGAGSLNAQASIVTNSTRSPSLGIINSLTSPTLLDSSTWLPTTLFVGDSTFSVKATGDILLGPVANPFLMPQGYNNTYFYKTYFSTYTAGSAVNVSSLAGNVTLRESITLPSTNAVNASIPILQAWYKTQLLLSSVQGGGGGLTSSNYQPWLKLAEDSVQPFATASTLMPGSLRLTAFTGGLNVVGTINLSPSANGTLDLMVKGAVNGLNNNGVAYFNGVSTNVWTAGWINLSDADPATIPGIASPFGYQTILGSPTSPAAYATQSNFLISKLDSTFSETGSTTGSAGVLQTKQKLHAAGLLHANDTTPVHIYALTGAISGFTLFSAKSTQVISGQDISDVSLYVQNNRASDISIVASARDIIPYNASTPLRVLALSSGNVLSLAQTPQAGDIQINGPGALEVLSGRNLDLGVGSNNSDGTGAGITSVGNGRNPYLPFAGADIFAAAGLGGTAVGLGGSSLSFSNFISSFGTSPAGSRYLTELADELGVPSINLNDPSLNADQRDRYALALFYLVLRDAGRDYNNPDSPNYRSYTAGFQAVSTLFPGTAYSGTINTESRDIRTKSGGNISLFAPGGGLSLSPTAIGTQLAPPGIITEAGGGISIFTNTSVDIGISRIFTLRGGDIVIWSSTGNIAAGTSAKTVQSAPPTRVLIDPQSASVSTDLAGLATGGGIGALATLTSANIKPSNIDLIAPVGAVDAGDAGIRATGNLNIAATIVLNSSNIQVAGSTSGAPSAPTVAAPNISGLSSANSTTAATSNVAAQQQQQQQQQQTMQDEAPSIITVEVLGYGGGDDDARKRNQPGE